jgi:hypothetical protein
MKVLSGPTTHCLLFFFLFFLLRGDQVQAVFPRIDFIIKYELAVVLPFSTSVVSRKFLFFPSFLSSLLFLSIPFFAFSKKESFF